MGGSLSQMDILEMKPVQHKWLNKYRWAQIKLWRVLWPVHIHIEEVLYMLQGSY